MAGFAGFLSIPHLLEMNLINKGFYDNEVPNMFDKNGIRKINFAFDQSTFMNVKHKK